MKEVSAEYIAKEEAAQRLPVELYHFWVVDGNHFYHTSGDVSVVYGGNTYVPATMKRGSVQYDSRLEVSTLDVTATPITDPVVDFIAMNPVTQVWVEVLKLFRDQDPYEACIIFLGQVATVGFKGLTANVKCVGFEAYLTQPIPRYRYQPECNNTLYDDKCKIDKDLYKVVATLSGLSSNGLELTSATFSTKADGYFRFGYVEFGIAKRMITDHVGTLVKIRYRIPDLENGDVVTAYAGCDLNIETCRDKFGNVNQFFGSPFIPAENPATWIT